MPKSQAPIFFEFPSYRSPSNHFRKFIEKLNQVAVPCYASVAKEKMTFIISSSNKATLQHCYRKSDRLETNKTRASIFASKVNATFSLAPKEEADVKIEIIETDTMSETELKEAKRNYGEDVICILRFTVECTTLESGRVLKNFFNLLDAHGN